MNLGICPACKGTGRRPAGKTPFKAVLYGYDADTDTLNCRNCGGQTMACHATGKVTLRPDGTPCLHAFKPKAAGRCYTLYTCEHCSYEYSIDSGD
jgi:hypothetical protein